MEKDRGINNLKLQKVLYYIQEAFLNKKGKECFEDRIKMWQYGPAVPSVNNIFLAAGSSPLKIFSLTTDGFSDIKNEDIDKDVWEMVKKFIK